MRALLRKASEASHLPAPSTRSHTSVSTPASRHKAEILPNGLRENGLRKDPAGDDDDWLVFVPLEPVPHFENCQDG